MATIKKYGLIGFPLEQSFSPKYFAKKFKAQKIKNVSYNAIEIKKISSIQKQLPKDILGFNVTHPHKQNILPFLDGMSKEAKNLGAVNTVKRENDQWVGYNTDVYGFEHSLKAYIKRRKIEQAMVLGNGGSAKAVRFVLKKLRIKANIISRQRGFRSYKYLSQEFIQQNLLIINTTPLGMGEMKNQKPQIPYHFITRKHLLFDLNYNPQKTLFLKEGEQYGARVKNGLEMLHLQAEESWRIWNS